MSRPSPAQTQWATRLLAAEGARGGGADAYADGAARVYDKMLGGLAPVLGQAGVHALLERSAKLSNGTFTCLANPANIESSAALRACLRALAPTVALDTATTLFGTFFDLLETFIGQRLTAQLLRGIWAELDEAPAEEKTT